MHLLGYGTQFYEWKFFGGDERPAHKHLLSNTISRAEFVSNIGRLCTESKETSSSLQFRCHL